MKSESFESIEKIEHVPGAAQTAETLNPITSPGGITEEMERGMVKEKEEQVTVTQKKIEEEGRKRKSIFSRIMESFSGDNKKIFVNKMDTRMAAWVNQDAIEKPSEEDIANIMALAEEENYDGTVGIENRKLVYVKKGNVNWTTGGHTFGGGA